jgi:hypothetical protein
MNRSRYLRLLSWGAVAAFVGCVAIARIGAQDPGNPFLDHGDRGELIHVLPAPAVLHNHNPRFTEPTEAEPTGHVAVFPSSTNNSLLTDHGGPEISNAAFVQIYYNGSVANSTATPNGTALQSYINGFANAFASGLNYDSSPTSDYTIIQQYGSSNGISASLLNNGQVVDSQGTTNRISDGGVQSYLATVFNRHLAVADANTVYGVYFPHGMKIALQGGTSCSAFCGYHSHFSYNGIVIKYAVFPYTDCRACSISGLTVADILTIVTSHEIRESVTDSLGSAWFDGQGNEADDKCAWQHLYQTANGNYFVQPEFSNGGTSSNSGFTATYPGTGCIVPR